MRAPSALCGREEMDNEAELPVVKYVALSLHHLNLSLVNEKITSQSSFSLRAVISDVESL